MAPMMALTVVAEAFVGGYGRSLLTRLRERQAGVGGSRPLRRGRRPRSGRLAADRPHARPERRELRGLFDPPNPSGSTRSVRRVLGNGRAAT